MHDVDVAVIGAGVVGLAIAAVLARSGRDVVVLEAEQAIGTVTSSRNSEVVHAGIYYPTSSWKALLCVEGRELLYRWSEAHGVPYRKVGKLIVATDEAEERKLERLQLKAEENGVRLEPLTASAARALEPEVRCTAALLSPETGIIDSHALMLSYQGEAEDHGAVIALGSPVEGGRSLPQGGLSVDCGGIEPVTLTCRTVINAAGLAAQRISRAFRGVSPESVPPLHLAKGNYFDYAKRPPFARLVYPMPVDGGLGVHYTVDMAGRGRFGPDVEWLDHDDPSAVDYAVDPRRGDAFYAAIRRYWPNLPDGSLQPGYAGLRPKVSGPGEAASDFVIQGPEDTGADGYFALYGIESPGLTASLAIASRVGSMVQAHS